MTNKWRRTERGVALVEFALILPFLAMATMATIDLGRVYTLQHRLANAAREGAAYAQYYPGRVDSSTPPSPQSSALCANPSNITYHVTGENADATGYTLTVTNMTSSAAVTGCHGEGQLTAGAIAPGSRIRIAVSRSFTPLTPFGKTFVGSSPTISRKTDVIVQGKSWS